MPNIYAKELDTLTVEDVLEWRKRNGSNAMVVSVVDLEEMTPEQEKKLMQLIREAVNRPLPLSYNLDAEKVNEKLQNISARDALYSDRPVCAPSAFHSRQTSSSHSSNGTPSTVGYTREEWIESHRLDAYENYEQLKTRGGRPSREINPEPGPCPPSKSDIDKEYHVEDHWCAEEGRTKKELARWEKFREYQESHRDSAEIFDKYKDRVSKFQQEKGIEWTAELQQDWQTQSQLVEWREYYIYEYRKRRALEKELKRAERKLALQEEKMRTAESNGSTVRVDLRGRAAESVKYQKEMSEARKEVELAQSRLAAAKIDVRLDAAERDASIWRAQEGLDTARKRLGATQSDELDMLHEEFERSGIEDGLRNCQGGVTCAEFYLEQLDTLLKWIEGEFPKIIAGMERAGQGQAQPSNSGPSPSESTRNDRQPKSGRNTRQKTKHPTAQSVIRPVHSSRVSKASRKRTRSLDRELARQRNRSSTPLADIRGQVAVQPSSKEPVRRSRRIAGLTLDSALSSSSYNSIAPRRSVRIAGRTEKQRIVASIPNLKPTQSSVASKRKSTRRMTQMNAGYSGRPQGISRTGSPRSMVKTRKSG